jgi:hypothetical protein
MRRTIVIGDLHGCLAELEALLAKCEATDEDQLISVGDLVAKGPDSRGVVQLLRERGAWAVKGNHDAHVLVARTGKASATIKPEHQQVLDTLTEADWKWLSALPLFVEVPEHEAIVVHAGLVPGVPLRDQPEDLMLTLRSITPQGVPTKTLEAGVPWASLWKGPQHVFFGHDAVRGLQQYPFATGLDTGCVYGKELSACVLPGRRIVQVKAKRKYS